MSFKIEGLDELTDIFDKASNNFESEAEKKLNAITVKAIRGVKLRTPVGKVNGGTLRRSWQSKSKKLERIVFNNVHYAPYVEYGHRTRGGKSFVEGRYMLTKTIEEISKDVDNEFSMLIENLFE
mgnify:CR=1 FL=1